LYLCLPPIWGAAGGDLVDPLYLWDGIQIPQKGKQVFKTLKERLSSKEIPTRNSSAGAWELWHTIKGH
jgi:hypothetical protein